MTTPTLAELIELRRQLPPIPPDAAKSSLSDRFIVPPFSVLDARQGYWQKRKKMWWDLGIRTELGEDTQKGITGGSPRPLTRGVNGTLPRNQQTAKTYNINFLAQPDNNWSSEGSSRSSFDPVVCELAFRWFSPVRGSVLDPCAGGITAGVVAAYCGRSFTGIDLNPDQVQANYKYAEAIGVLSEYADQLRWIVGDATEVEELCGGNADHNRFDFIFSCPPYADLEVYSDDPRDLSNMPYSRFLETYNTIITRSCHLLKQDRFACFVVGDIRDKKTGNYRNFVGDTVTAFQQAGLELYNEAILVTSVGSLRLTTGRQFVRSRKLGKSHQQVLVFLKGDATRAAAACGEVDVDDLDMPECKVGALALEVDDNKVELLDSPLIEAALYCDVWRGQARNEGLTTPRCWLGTADGWTRVPDHEELTYVVGSSAYLNRGLFPDAKGPRDTPPSPRRVR